jgi:hypothetical protein
LCLIGACTFTIRINLLTILSRDRQCLMIKGDSFLRLFKSMVLNVESKTNGPSNTKLNIFATHHTSF